MTYSEALKYVNIDEGLKRVLNKPALYARLLKMFLLNEQHEQLKNSINKKEIQVSAEQAHALKGITGNLSLTPLFNVTVKLMEQLRAGELNNETFNEYLLLYDKTVEAVNVVIEELSKQG